jgi:hypothetical protein
MHYEYKPIKRQLIHLFETKTIQDLADGLISGEAFIAITGKRKKI